MSVQLMEYIVTSSYSCQNESKVERKGCGKTTFERLSINLLIFKFFP